MDQVQNTLSFPPKGALIISEVSLERVTTAAVLHMYSTSNERVNSESIDEVVVFFLGAGEQFGHQVQLGVHLPGGVQERLGHAHWRVVAIVQSEPVEDPRHRLQERSQPCLE